MKKLQPRITTLQYVESQIVELFDKEIIYGAQIKIAEQTVLIKDKKEAALKAISVLQEQLTACDAQIKAWDEYRKTLTK